MTRTSSGPGERIAEAAGGTEPQRQQGTPTRPLEWMRAIRDDPARPTAAQLLVLWSLALRLGPDGYGFASLATLASDCGQHPATVKRATRWARGAGYLERTRRGHRLGDGTIVASEYRLVVPAQRRTGAPLSPQPERRTGAPLTISRAQTGHLKGADGAPQGRTGAPPRGPTPRGPTSSPRAPARERLRDAGADDATTTKILDSLKSKGVKNPDAYLHTLVGNGDIRTLVEQHRERSKPKPSWCGHCDEDSRLIELEDGAMARCTGCHPLEVPF